MPVSHSRAAGTMAVVNLPRTLAAGLLAVVFVLTTAACGGVKNPEGWASPVVTDSTLYYFPRKDRLTALSVQPDGAFREAWSIPMSGQQEPKVGFKAVYDATIDGNTLFFGSWDGKFYAVSGVDGSVRWTLSSEIDGGVVGGPIVADGKVIFGTTDGKLYVRDAATGQPAQGWDAGGVSFSEGIWAAPVVSAGVVFVATMDGEVSAFRLADGARAWDKPFKNSGAIADLTLIDADRLFVPGLNKKVTIVSTADGSVVAGPFTMHDWVWSRPAVQGNVAYFGDFGGKVHALDITNGVEVWGAPYDAGTRVKSAPVVIGDMLIVATREPAVHFIDRTTGQAKNTVPLDAVGSVRANLVVRDGKALVATTKGKLLEADPARLAVTPLTIVSVAK